MQKFNILFDHHIQNLLNRSDNFVFKNNLELFKNFYQFLYTKFKDLSLCETFLLSFERIEEIKPDEIESIFSTLLLETNDGYFDLTSFEQFHKKSGVYFIYNQNENLIYIGKSNNLQVRALQSFVNKLVYGATEIKIIELPNEYIDFYEAVCIDYFKPMYNNKYESFNSNHRLYCKCIENINRFLDLTESIYPSCIKHNREVSEMSVFQI